MLGKESKKAKMYDFSTRDCDTDKLTSRSLGCECDLPEMTVVERRGDDLYFPTVFELQSKFHGCSSQYLSNIRY